MHTGNLSTTTALCMTHLAASTALSRSQAFKLCSDGAFTGQNSARLAERMRRVVQQQFSCPPLDSPARDQQAARPTPVCLLDAHRLTSGLDDCAAATSDGRHYSTKVVQQEVAMLRARLADMHVSVSLDHSGATRSPLSSPATTTAATD